MLKRIVVTVILFTAACGGTVGESPDAGACCELVDEQTGSCEFPVAPAGELPICEFDDAGK